jgi:uncharacterized integral membrane protein (TIGR00697 family)
MINELIFLLQAVLVAGVSLFTLWLGKEALIAFICVQCILANLFVVKQTMLCGLAATCSDAFSIGAVLGLNLLQEYYGKTITKKTIVLSFLLLLFYVLFSYLHMAYLPHAADTTHGAFALILSSMPRIVAASFLVYLLVQYLDAQLYALLKKRFDGRYHVVRTAISLGVSQLLDTVLFSFVGLYGIIEHIGEVIVVSYSIKLAAICIALPFVWFSRKVVGDKFI